jgi:transposase
LEQRTLTLESHQNAKHINAISAHSLTFYPLKSAMIQKDIGYRRVYSRPVDKATGLRIDQTIRLTNDRAIHTYPTQLRLVRFFDQKTGKRFIFLTNNFDLPALNIASLYRSRWDIELFFRRVKQHLRIKSFFGLSENAVHIQIWIAIGTYALIAIARKRLGLTHLSLYTVLQILSISIVDKKPILQAFHDLDYSLDDMQQQNRLILPGFPIGH